MRRFFFSVVLLWAFSNITFAQNTNSSTTTNARPRTSASKTQTNKAAPTRSVASPPDTKQAPAKPAATPAPAADTVLAAFNKIIDGIRKANVNLVTEGYWNSPTLVLFNYNGSVTRGWDQMRKNRESSYPDIKDVKLDVRDVHVQMLGRDGAVVTCLWTQTQTYKGAPETATGRMTLAFKRVGTAWKAVHLHTSPDRADAARVPASEQTQTPSPTPTKP
jgi:ketosteroid isomerase-like protein